MKAISIASALGTTSAYTWLKVPIVEDMERVMAASTLPALVLGGGGPGGLRRLGPRARAPDRARAGHRPLAAVPDRRRRRRGGGPATGLVTA